MEKLAKLRKGQRTRLMNYGMFCPLRSFQYVDRRALGLWSGPTAPGTPSAAPTTPAAEATPAAGRPPTGSTPLAGFTLSEDTLQSFTHPADDDHDTQNGGDEGQGRKNGKLGPKRKKTQEESNADEEEARGGGHAGEGSPITKKMRSSDGSMPTGSMSNSRMGSGSTDGGVRVETPYGLGRDGDAGMGGFSFRGGMGGGFESGGGGGGGADGLQGQSNRSVNTTTGAGRPTDAEVSRLRVDVDRLTRALQAAQDRFRMAMGRRHQEGQE